MTGTLPAMTRLSTEEVPRDERMGFVHDFIGRHIGGLHFYPEVPGDLRIDLQAMSLPGGLTVGQGRFSPMRGARTRDLLQDGREHYLLTIHHEDYEVAADGKEPVRVRAGDITLMDEAVCSEFWFGKATTVDAVALDRRLLLTLAPRFCTNGCFVLPATASHMPLFTNYLDALIAGPPATGKAQEIAARHIYDLVSIVLDDHVPGGAARNECSVAAVRLKLIRKDILERLADASLQIEDVALRQRVTVRYVQRLFESEGTTFSDFLRTARLDLAFRLLQERGVVADTIASIAYDTGFSDISVFNRAFRRRFDATPSEIRAKALIG